MFKVSQWKFKVPTQLFTKLRSMQKTYPGEKQTKIKFSSDIAKKLTEWIQKLKIPCSLIHENNNFKVGERKAAPFWSGTFHCNNRDIINKSYCANYEFRIPSFDENKNNVIFDCFVIGKLYNLKQINLNGIFKLNYLKAK
jgi:hypothetical protein